MLTILGGGGAVPAPMHLIVAGSALYRIIPLMNLRLE